METLLAHILLPLSTCYLLLNCMCSFIAFVSMQNTIQSQPDAPVITLGVLDLCLVILFIVQHKVMSSNRHKQLLELCGISVVERLIHVAVTSFTLLVVMTYWEPITSVHVWYIDTSDRISLWLFFFLFHGLAWFVMILDALTMEPLEMIGLKQIYNYHFELAPPIKYLPKMLQRCYGSVRHPGPFLLVLMLWVHPQMTLDRLILAYLFTWFLWCGFHMSPSQYRHVSKWLVEETRREVVFITRNQTRRPSGRPNNKDSGWDSDLTD